MINQQGWLPPLVELSEEGEGNYPLYIDKLYEYYTEDFIYHPPELFGKPVRTNTNAKREGKEESFWHILEGKMQDTMAEDLGRHRRIRWIKPIIEAVSSDKVKWWRRTQSTSKRRKQVRLHIALNDFSYVVVLIEYKRYFILLTAFSVERDRRRRKYREEWDACNPEP